MKFSAKSTIIFLFSIILLFGVHGMDGGAGAASADSVNPLDAAVFARVRALVTEASTGRYLVEGQEQRRLVKRNIELLEFLLDRHPVRKMIVSFVLIWCL